MPINYSNGKIYQICSDECEEVYIGSTTQSLSKRMVEHRSKYKNRLIKKDYSGRSANEILKYPDAKIYLIEDYPCENKEQLEKREGEVIREANCVNRRIAGRSQSEYVAENREKKAKRQAEYQAENREKIAEKKAKYYIENREKIAEKAREKITCECGSTICKNDLSRHLKSKKHLKFVEDSKNQS